MQWSDEAEAAVKKVPFFVRKKVRARVENEADRAGKKKVSLSDVKATQARFLKNMSREVKGYGIDTCFAAGGCPNRAVNSERLLETIETFMAKQNLLGFLKQQVKGKLKFHHNFKITFADCPNACSQPQIKDIGIIGAASPATTDEPCTLCQACVSECKDNAIELDAQNVRPKIDFEHCMHCGKCADVCPTGTLSIAKTGYRVQLGGKLGRHPKLARELPGIFNEATVVEIVQAAVDFYKQNSTGGQRFSSIFTDADFHSFAERFK